MQRHVNCFTPIIIQMHCLVAGFQGHQNDYWKKVLYINIKLKYVCMCVCECVSMYVSVCVSMCESVQIPGWEGVYCMYVLYVFYVLYVEALANFHQ